MAADPPPLARGRAELRGGTLRVVGQGRGPARSVGVEPVSVGRDPSCQIVLHDPRVSAIHAEFAATPLGVRARDLGSRHGTFLGQTRLTEIYLTHRCRLTVGETALEFEPLAPEKVPLGQAGAFGPLVGESLAMRAVFDRLARAAPTELTVLILGETGTGKELAAQALHAASARRAKPFVVVDCGALSPSLAEAALFGHEKGAFTGADQRRPSPFEEAAGGTVFLDELGELPLDLQPKLLRVLAERRVKPVGANAYRSVDVRVLAATRRDLVRSVNDGSFRSDLYFRVAQLRVELPPLRERVGDLPLLVRTMLADFGDPDAFARVSPETLDRLTRHDWPGNVRELRNAVTAAVALSDGGDVAIASHLGALERASFGTGSIVDAEEAPLSRDYHRAKREALSRFEQEYFRTLARECGGNVSKMAEVAGLARVHVRRYLDVHGLREDKRPGRPPKGDSG
ncbi:MAG TPA: sigma 54-interacting transcriptional regulator [Polyangiaceae bacterium]|nr:sigma 54-interacting transcriptional regulator [Polyangiaceae bacterium]